MKKLVFIWVLSFFSVSIGFANTDHYQAIITQGNVAYTQEKYAEASELYLQVVAANYESPILFYNLGNALFKQQKFTDAILYYEKAKKLAPGNTDVAFNLELANKTITDKIEPIPELFFTTWWKSFISLFGIDTWGWISIFCLTLAVVVYALYNLAKTESNKRTYFYLSVGLLLLTIVTYTSGIQQKGMVQNANEAIIFTPSVSVKSSPSLNSTDLFIVHEGTKVKLLESIDPWHKISLSDGNVGWIMTDTFVEI